MMHWWVDRGVDGFRMDVINLISKDVAADGSLADGLVPDGTGCGAAGRWSRTGRACTSSCTR